MRDYTYRDVYKNEIILVCVGVENLCQADYHFKDIMGFWPWKVKGICADSETSALVDEYIPATLED